MFTRRHYVWLASVARDMISTSVIERECDDDTIILRRSVNRAIETLTDALADENPAFNREKFLDKIYNRNLF